MKSEKIKSRFGFIFNYLRDHWRLILVCFLLFLLLTPLSLSGPWFLKLIIDLGFQKKNFSNILYLSALLLVIRIMTAIIGYLLYYRFNLLAQKITIELRESIFNQAQNIHINDFNQLGTGKIFSYILKDVSILAQTMSVSIFNFVIQTFIFFAVLFSMFVLQPLMTLIVLLIFPLYYLLLHYFNPKIQKINHKIRSIYDSFSTHIQDMINGTQEIRAFGIEDIILKHFRKLQQFYFDANMKNAKYIASSEQFSGLIISLPIIFIFVYGGFLSLKGNFTIGSLIAFIQFSAMLFSPVKQVVSLIVNIQGTIPSLDRLIQFFSFKSFQLDETNGKRYIEKLEPITINLKNINFSYNNKQVLYGLNLEIPPRHSLALVGQSGGGKTTIARLLHKLYAPEQGEVLLNSIPINKISRQELHQHISVVLQDNYWFHGSILENFRLIQQDLSEQELEKVLRKVNALDFVQKLPKGMHTYIERGGKNFSGGQIKRLSIARALLRDPEVLIFDEITSDLDPESENVIQNLIQTLSKDKTIIVISHREDIVSICDSVAFLKKGSIHAIGKHQELLTYNPEYRTHFFKEKSVHA